MTKSGITPSKVLCIGDEMRDIEAAKEAATAFGAVAWGYTRVDVLKAQANIDLFYSVNDILMTVLGPDNTSSAAIE